MTSNFRPRFTSFDTHPSFLTFFVCFFVLFHASCSHSHPVKNTLHEFHISYSHTEWYTSFFHEAKQFLLWPTLRLSKSHETQLMACSFPINPLIPNNSPLTLSLILIVTYCEPQNEGQQQPRTRGKLNLFLEFN